MSLSFYPCLSEESERFADSRAARGLWEGGGEKSGCEDAGGGDRQRIPSLDTAAAVWRAGAHFKTVLLARFCLFLSSSLSFAPPAPSSSYFCHFFYLYFYLSFFLVALTSPDWSFSRQCSSKQMSQAGLTLLYRHPASSFLSSPLSLQTQPADCIAQRGGEKEKNLSPSPHFNFPSLKHLFIYFCTGV